MRKIAKEGHSFPHYDSCNTCIDEFDEVCKFERKRILKLISKEVPSSWLHPMLDGYICRNEFTAKDIEKICLEIRKRLKQKIKEEKE